MQTISVANGNVISTGKLWCSALLALWCMSLDASACTRAEYEKDFPIAIEAVSQWETRTQIVLGIQVRETVLGEFCTSGRELVREKNLPQSEINQVSGKVITEYLDRAVDFSKPGRTMGAILRSAFGVQGFSRPQIKRWGRLKISYTQPVDATRIGAERLGRVSEILLPIGKVVLTGFRGTNVLCEGEVVITATEEVKFTC
jgi:hypothetical protein